jgi:hypothetical protein
MFPKFFKHKMREVGSFFKIIKGKATKNDQQRAEGVDDALRAMKEERRVYQEEKEDALRGVDKDTKRRNRPNEKVLRTEVDRDISAI